jgi:arabinogalactan oligomer / maltooligosaccharide transport system permease protein
MRKIPFWRQVLTQLALLLAGIFVILPVWGIARLAFDGSLHGRPVDFFWFPKVWSFTAFLKVLDRPYGTLHFSTLLKNSLTVSFGAAAIALVLGMSLAYAFARFRFPGRSGGLFILLLTAILPPVAFMIPLYVFLSIVGLRTTLIGLTFVYAIFAMPFCIWNMRAAFQAVPREVEESAFLDGASNLVAFGFITLPLALPSIAVAGLIAFLMAYSEFAIGFFFVEKPNTVTLAMAVYSMVQTQFNSGAQPWSYLGSMVLIMSIPVVIIFILLQNYLLERMLFGTISD